MNEELMTNADAVISRGMEQADLFINRNYLIHLNDCQPVELSPAQKSFSYLSLFRIQKIVCDSDENINDKLVSVYSALSNFGSGVLLVLTSHGGETGFYLGTRDQRDPTVAREILRKSLKGNFPGIEMREQTAGEVEALLESHIPNVYSGMALSSVSIVPSPRDSDKEHFVQGLEKFIDSMSGEDYTAVFISSPLGKEQLEVRKRGYEELYSTLSQFAEVNLTYGENDSEAIAKGVSDSFSTAVNEGISDTMGTNSSRSKSASKGKNKSFGYHLFFGSHSSGKNTSKSTSTSEGSSSAHAETRSNTETTGKTTSDTSTSTRGTTSTFAVTRRNKTVQALLDRIDEQLERIKQCEAYGLWDSACYFLSKNPQTSLVAANTFKAIVAGQNTSVENSFINCWDNEYEHAKNSLMLMDHLRYGLHPEFEYLPSGSGAGYAPQIVTPASLISGLELPVLQGFPHKSVNGVTSLSAAEFGRNVFTQTAASKRNLDIGAIFHMGETFRKSRVRLNLESLSSHCFITGSTGSGKSNATYKIIEELTAPKNRVKFLVIEPAKGEYKLAFGKLPGVQIFTTNPNYHSMLRLNPFAFHPEIHVLEHLDRLISIFSACWPLYAAMPALLKAAFEQAYVRHGWDLNHSIHIDLGNGTFPTFRDALDVLPVLLEKSDFSAQTKGDYVGSLVTRIESLTNGLLGQIFSDDAIEDRVFFDENTIIDLSRIGSAETKALLMGVLVLKLSEYRQSTSAGTNLPLQHVTILEEAHNLLKRTSTEQGQESANVQGKSVEMISNSIAEMRTYGEGFLIVDQSPSAVDISAIKNTNTKIILRLPEASDCEAIGRSVGLDERQIAELSRLDTGVAVIYQNHWLEAVLCRIDRCSDRYEAAAPVRNDPAARLQLVGDLLVELFTQNASNEFNMSWFQTILTDAAQVPQDIRQRCRTALLDYQKVRARCEAEKKRARPDARKRIERTRKEAYHALTARLLDCDGLFRMYEERLPPVVRDVSQIDDDYRTNAQNWAETVCRSLDAYAVFPDDRTRDSAFLNLLLHQVAVSGDPRYKFALYCL